MYYQLAIALCQLRKSCWSDDFTQVIGKTPCGRATVEALRLNRFGVVNLRRLLRSANLHPPENVEGDE